MLYPPINDYISSISSAENNLSGGYSRLKLIIDNFGEPIMKIGKSAVVFKMQDPLNGRFYAVKCFLKNQNYRADDYALINNELERYPSQYINTVHYLEDGLFVNSSDSGNNWFPILIMDWVEGIPLSVYIREHIDDSNALSHLCYQFGNLANWLLPQPFAHGNLNPDNILVRADGSLCLVSYDNMYVPAMLGKLGPELAETNYLHPLRIRDDFNERIDDFSIASIALSLKAISLNPDLLHNTESTEGLLLSDKDYSDLGSSNMIKNIALLLSNNALCSLYATFLFAHSHIYFAEGMYKYFRLSRPNVDRLSTNPPVRKFSVDGISFDMIYVEGGTFDMGSVQPVNLSPYYIGKFVVTRDIWYAVMRDGRSCAMGDNYPVNFAKYSQCKEFIEKLNSLTGAKFSLPTEAQWEFAARGGVKSEGYKYAGSNGIDDVAWYNCNSDGLIHPVGMKKPNELGLYDMCGNVFEWCNDWYEEHYSYEFQTNPTGPKDPQRCRVLRGGNCNSNPMDLYNDCQISNRYYSFPDNGVLCCNGFRLALSL